MSIRVPSGDDAGDYSGGALRLAHVPPALRRLIYQEGYSPAVEADRPLLAERIYPLHVEAAGSLIQAAYGGAPAPAPPSAQPGSGGAWSSCSEDDHLQVLLTRAPLVRSGVPRVGVLISCANRHEQDAVARRLQLRLRSLLLLDGGVIQRYAAAAESGPVAMITAPWALRSAVRRAAASLMHLDPLLRSMDGVASGGAQIQHDAAALGMMLDQAGGLERHLGGARHMVWRFSDLTARDCVLPGRGALWALYLDDAGPDAGWLRIQLLQQAIERVEHLAESNLRLLSVTVRGQISGSATSQVPSGDDGARHFAAVESGSNALPSWGVRAILRASWMSPKTRRAIGSVLAELLGVTAECLDEACDAEACVVADRAPLSELTLAGAIAGNGMKHKAVRGVE